MVLHTGRKILSPAWQGIPCTSGGQAVSQTASWLYSVSQVHLLTCDTEGISDQIQRRQSQVLIRPSKKTAVFGMWWSLVLYKYSGKQLRTQRTTHHYNLFIHSFVCLTTGPQHLPKRVLHWVRPSPSSYNFKDPFFSLTSSSSCLHLIPRLAVTTIIPSVCPLIACVRRQLLRKTWQIQLDFLIFIVCMIFHSSLTLCSTS
jgi:hypothetical protein